MTTSNDLGSDFILAFSRLSGDPESYTARQQVLAKLAEVKAQAAQGNPMAYYRLAMAFPPKSDKYCELMQKAAELGSTNAMFALMKHYVDINPKLSARFAQQILASQDQFLIGQTQDFLATRPELAKTNRNHFFQPTQSDLEAHITPKPRRAR